MDPPCVRDFHNVVTGVLWVHRVALVVLLGFSAFCSRMPDALIHNTQRDV